MIEESLPIFSISVSEILQLTFCIIDMYYTYQALLKYNAQTRKHSIARAHAETFIPLHIKVAHTNIKRVMRCQYHFR